MIIRWVLVNVCICTCVNNCMFVKALLRSSIFILSSALFKKMTAAKWQKKENVRPNACNSYTMHVKLAILTHAHAVIDLHLFWLELEIDHMQNMTVHNALHDRD